MSINPNFGKAQSIVRQKLMVYEEMAAKVQRIKQQQEELEKSLLAQAPESLRDFLAEGWLSSTLDYGTCTGKAELVDCNCKSYDEAREKFNELKKAWKYVITVCFPTKKDYANAGRLELKLSIN
jgi:hypothetical protein